MGGYEISMKDSPPGILGSRTSLIEVEGVVIAIHEWGPAGSDRTVLFWHGAELHSGLSFAEVGSFLASAGVRSIALDAPGFGVSPEVYEARPELAHPRRLARLATEAASQVGVERAVFVGHSWGAHVACWAGCEPEPPWTALVLLDGGFFDFAELFGQVLGLRPEEALSFLRSKSSANAFSDWDAYLSHVRADRPRWSPVLDEIYRAAAWLDDSGRIRPRASAATSAAIAEPLMRDPTSQTWPVLARSGIPVVLELSTVPAEAASRRRQLFLEPFMSALPQSTVRLVEGASHELLEDTPKEVAEAIAQAAQPQ